MTDDRRTEQKIVVDGATITIVHQHSAPDGLVKFPFGLQRATAMALIRSGELPSRKLGQHHYARRSDVLALIDRIEARKKPATKGDVAADIEAIARRAGAPRRKRAS